MDHGKCKQRSRTKRMNAECNSIHGIFRSDRTACMQRAASLELFHFLIDGAYFYFGTARFKGRMKVNFCISVLHCRVFFLHVDDRLDLNKQQHLNLITVFMSPRLNKQIVQCKEFFNSTVPVIIVFDKFVLQTNSVSHRGDLTSRLLSRRLAD